MMRNGTNIKSLSLERFHEETLFWNNIPGYRMVLLNNLRKIELINPDFDCFHYHTFFSSLKEGMELNFENDSRNPGDMPFERDYGSVPNAMSRMKKARITKLNRQQMVTVFQDIVRSENLILKNLTLEEITPLYSGVFIKEHQTIAEGINKLEKFAFSHRDNSKHKMKLPMFIQKMFLIMDSKVSNLKELCLQRINLDQINCLSKFLVFKMVFNSLPFQHPSTFL